MQSATGLVQQQAYTKQQAVRIADSPVMNPPTLVGAALTAASLLVTQSSPAGSPVQVSRFRSTNSTIKETRPLKMSDYKDTTKCRGKAP